MIKLIQGDCLEEMRKLAEEGVKVDLVLTDPPYGTTACKWDNVIPFDEMWDCIKKIRYDDTPILLFGNEPFSSYLRMSNITEYKYDWKWDKVVGTNFVRCNNMPLKIYEDIMVFYKKSGKYTPLRIKREKPLKRGASKSSVKNHGASWKGNLSSHYKYPTNKLEYNRCSNELNSRYLLHPTQKPVKLLEYLIKTYTKEDEIVLDFTMGSGSTGVACLQTNRNFIGIELDEEYYNIAKSRCSNFQSTF